MKFAAGLVTGLAIAAACVGALWWGGLLAWRSGDESPVVGAGPLPASSDAGVGTRRLRAGRRGASKATEGSTSPGLARTTDDDIDFGEPRHLDLGTEGGEANVDAAQVNGAFDRGFPALRRCLALAAGDVPVRGTLRFTIGVAPTGRFERVALAGPRELTSGDAADCLRTTVRSFVIPPFDGPAGVARYSLTLD